MKLKVLGAALSALMLFPPAAMPQVASGGDFTLEKAAVTSGGERMSGGNFELVGNTGQHLAGGISHAMPQFMVRSGFYTPRQLVPTSAQVIVSGRVTMSGGRGIHNVKVTATAVDGTVLAAITNSFGFYAIEGLSAGQSYVISARHRSHNFEARVITPEDNITDLDFQPLPPPSPTGVHIDN